MKRLVFILSLILGVSVMAMAWASDGNFKLKLKTSMIDTRDAQKSTNSKTLEGGKTNDGKAFYIIQFDGPVLDEWKKALEAKGVRFFSYIPVNAFLVKLDPSTQSSVMFSPHVQYVGEYRPEYKISRGLNNKVRAGYSTFATSASTEAVLALRVKVFDKEPLKPVIAAIEKMNGTVEVISDGDGLNEKVLKVQIPFYKAAGIAGIAEVEWVEPFTYAKLSMDVARVVVNADAAQSLPRPLDGRGQIVGVLDSGLDIGSTSKIHAIFGNASTMHPAFAGKTPDGKSKISGHISYRDDGSWRDEGGGHGTFVAGIMTGMLFDPLQKYQGIAPGARLFVQSGQTYDDFMKWPDLNRGPFLDAYNAGVRVLNCSWSTMYGELGDYDIQAVQIDTFAWRHKDFLPVFAAGNYASDVFWDYSADPTKTKTSDGLPENGSISPPSTAKNVLTVGATEGARDGYGAYSSYFRRPSIYFSNFSGSPVLGWDVGGAAKYDRIAAYSGRGPTQDGRTKPDVVAPGNTIVSAQSRFPNDLGYFYSIYGVGGTSFATPMVSGAAAVVRQYYKDIRGVAPSAALVKATIINGATDIGNGVPVPPLTDDFLRPFGRPDFAQGWGLLNVMGAVYPGQPDGDPTTIADSFLAFVDNKVGIGTGGGKSYRFHLNNTNRVRVTLVWTDYPAAIGADTQLVNDLDLNVLTDDGNYSSKQSGFNDPHAPWYNNHGTIPYDYLNNVESVEFDPSASGDIYVNIYGSNVPFGPQPFAIVVTGGLDVGTTHTISGKALQYVGKVASPFLSAVTVVATGPVIVSTTTASDGSFTLSSLPPGKYYLNVYESWPGGALLSIKPNTVVTIGTSATAGKTGLLLKCAP